MKHEEIEQPLNPIESYLYGINVRLNVLIDQMSGVVEALSSLSNQTVEQAKVEVETSPIEVKPKTRTRKV